MELWQGTQDGDAAQDALADAGLTDGLPVVPPTRARVEHMLESNGYRANDVVSSLAPLFRAATWMDIAINAVMAGCRPEYLPVIGAALEAMSADEFNLMGIGTTTGSAAPLIIVNGPIVKTLGINAASNALGPGNRANATIGRAINLALRNIGGADPGVIDMATLGQPAKYTFCLAENEAASPWPPLHAERGFDANASVVTVFGASGIVEMIDSVSSNTADLAQTYAQSMLMAGTASGSGYLGGGEPLILMPPEIAAICERDGHDKEQVKAQIYERAVMPLECLSPAMRKRIVAERMRTGAENPHAALRIAERARDVIIVIAGGVGIKAAYVPEWGASRAVSRRIRASKLLPA